MGTIVIYPSVTVGDYVGGGWETTWAADGRLGGRRIGKLEWTADGKLEWTEDSIENIV